MYGFPTSGHMFRDLIPALADRCRVIAPDLPGFGHTVAPDRASFTCSFDRLAETIDGFTTAMGLARYALYIFDYAAPVGLRLAMLHPERISAIVTQNGNAYLEGLSEGYRRGLPDAEIHFVDAGHFALETYHIEIAALMRDFLAPRAG